METVESAKSRGDFGGAWIQRRTFIYTKSSCRRLAGCKHLLEGLCGPKYDKSVASTGRPDGVTKTDGLKLVQRTYVHPGCPEYGVA